MIEKKRNDEKKGRRRRRPDCLVLLLLFPFPLPVLALCLSRESSCFSWRDRGEISSYEALERKESELYAKQPYRKRRRCHHLALFFVARHESIVVNRFFSLSFLLTLFFSFVFSLNYLTKQRHRDQGRVTLVLAARSAKGPGFR